MQTQAEILAETRAANLAKGRNKGGRPASMMQDPGPRMKALLQMHGVAFILRAMRDEDFLAQHFTAYDAMLIMGVANSLKGNGDERERVLNRMFGKVPDKTVNLNVNIEVEPRQITERGNALLDAIMVNDDPNDLI